MGTKVKRHTETKKQFVPCEVEMKPAHLLVTVIYFYEGKGLQ